MHARAYAQVSRPTRHHPAQSHINMPHGCDTIPQRPAYARPTAETPSRTEPHKHAPRLRHHPAQSRINMPHGCDTIPHRVA
eukprot:359260-Chlamydomonas_euryale.AAC.9